MTRRLEDMTIDLACCSWSFEILPLRNAVRVAKAIGFDRIDLGFAHVTAHSEPPDLDMLSVTKVVADEETEVSDLFALLPFETNDVLEEHRAANLRAFEMFVRMAVECEAGGMTIKPGVPLSGETDDGWAAAVDALGEFVRRATAYGVALAVEPHVGSITETPERALALTDAVDGLALTLDYSHFVSAGVPMENVPILFPRARHVHLRQARPGTVQTGARDGTISFPTVVRTMIASGYSGVFATEFQNSDWGGMNDIDVLSETVRLIQSLGTVVTGDP